MELPSSRYFLWAERLRHRPGAVRGALVARELAATPRPAAEEQSPPGPQLGDGDVQRLDDPRELERLTNQNGFMGFEYVGG